MSDEQRIDRVVKLAQVVWPEWRLRVHVNGAGYAAVVTSCGIVLLSVKHSRALEALEGALLVLVRQTSLRTPEPEPSDIEGLLQRAVDLWGEEAQMRMVQEECAELIATVNRHQRERCSNEDVAEEVADVLIMVEQARRIVGAAAVDAAKERKLQRLARRLTDGEQRRLAGWHEAFDRGERL